MAANTKELVVEKLELKHSHSCDPELVQLYPERRSLSHARCADEVCASSKLLNFLLFFVKLHLG